MKLFVCIGFKFSVVSLFLGVFTKLRKVTIGFVISVCLSIRLSTWNISAPNGQKFKTLGIRVFFPKSIEKILLSSDFEKNKGDFT